MGTVRVDSQPAPGCPPLGVHTLRVPSPSVGGPDLIR